MLWIFIKIIMIYQNNHEQLRLKCIGSKIHRYMILKLKRWQGCWRVPFFCTYISKVRHIWGSHNKNCQITFMQIIDNQITQPTECNNTHKQKHHYQYCFVNRKKIKWFMAVCRYYNTSFSLPQQATVSQFAVLQIFKQVNPNLQSWGKCLCCALASSMTFTRQSYTYEASFNISKPKTQWVPIAITHATTWSYTNIPLHGHNFTLKGTTLEEDQSINTKYAWWSVWYGFHKCIITVIIVANKTKYFLLFCNNVWKYFSKSNMYNIKMHTENYFTSYQTRF